MLQIQYKITKNVEEGEDLNKIYEDIKNTPNASIIRVVEIQKPEIIE